MKSYGGRLLSTIIEAFEHSGDGIAVIEADSGEILYHNRTWVRLHAKEDGRDYTGQTIHEFERNEIHPLIDEIRARLREHGTFSKRFSSTRRDGKHQTVHILANMVGEVEPPMVIIAMRDITELVKVEDELRCYRDYLQDLVDEKTKELRDKNEQLQREIGERREAEAALVEREEIMRALINAPTEVALLIKTDGTVVEVNDAVVAFVGREREDIIGRNAFDLLSPPTAEFRKKCIEQILSTGRPCRFVDHEGEKWYDSSVYPVFNASGEVGYFAIYSLDITAHKKSEEELRRYHEHLEELIRERTEELEKRNSELSVLNDLNRIIYSASSSKQVLVWMLERIAGFCGSPYAALFRIEKGAGGLVLVAHHGLPEDVSSQVRRIVLDGTRTNDLIGRASVAVLEEDMPGPSEGKYERIMQQLGIKRTILFATKAKERTIYLTMLGMRTEGDISPALREFLSIVGNQLGIALERLALVDALEKREKELAKLAGRLIDTIEGEKRQMARALHDDMVQSLVSLNLEFDMLEKRLPKDRPKIQSSIRKIREELQRVTESTRQSSYQLHPPMLEDIGLIPALHWYIDRVIANRGIEVEVEAVGFDEELPDQVGLTIYRVAQEALTNVLRHSGASRVHVKLTKGFPSVILRIEDNGSGFSVEGTEAPVGGLGIIGMRERVSLLGGSFRIRSSTGKGTRIRVTLPLEVKHGG